MHNLNLNSTAQVIGSALTAGTDGAFVQPAVSVDMARFSGCYFLAFVVGVTDSLFACRVKAAATTSGHSAVGSATGVVASIAATAVGANTRVFRIDVANVRDNQRYLRFEYQRTVANSQVTIVAIPYNAKTQPATQLADVAASATVSGAAGAA